MSSRAALLRWSTLALLLLCAKFAIATPWMWGAHGIVVRQQTHPWWYSASAASDTGGQLLLGSTWQSGHLELRAQFVTAKGQALWGDHPALVASSLHSPRDFAVSSVVGGWIAAWMDYPNGDASGEFDGDGPAPRPMHHSRAQLWIQRLDRDGNRLLGDSGLCVSDTAWHSEGRPQVVDDRQGGAFIVWLEGDSIWLHVSAQHLDSVGHLSWPNPVRVSGDVNALSGTLSAAPSSNGSALIVWSMVDTARQNVLRVALLALDSSLAWEPAGRVLATTSSQDLRIRLLPDGAGGCLLAQTWSWTGGNRGKVQINRIDSAGHLTESGFALDINHPLNLDTQLALSRAGNQIDGCLLLSAYCDPVESCREIRVWKCDVDGTARWGDYGQVVATLSEAEFAASFRMEALQLVSDGHGGALLGWQKMIGRDPPEFADRRISRLDSAGRPAWGSSGVSVLDMVADVRGLTLAPDSAGLLCIFQERAENDLRLHALRLEPLTGAAPTGEDRVAMSEPLVSGGDDVQAVPLAKDRVALLWTEEDRQGSRDVSYQILDPSGAPSVPPAGKPLLRFAKRRYARGRLMACADGKGGLFAALPVEGHDNQFGESVRMARLSADGVLAKSLPEGAPVWLRCAGSEFAMAPAGGAGCYVAALDDRNDWEFPRLVRLSRVDRDLRTVWGGAVADRQHGIMHLLGISAAADSAVLVLARHENYMDTTTHAISSSLNAGWIDANNVGVWFKVIADHWERYSALMASDQHDGAYIVWSAAYGRTSPDHTTRVQHVNRAGEFLWGADGIELPDTSQDYPLTILQAESDSAGFLFLLCSEFGEYRVRKFSRSGEQLWPGSALPSSSSDTIRVSPGTVAKLSDSKPHLRNRPAAKPMPSGDGHELRTMEHPVPKAMPVPRSAKGEPASRMRALKERPKSRYPGKWSGSGRPLLVPDGTGGCLVVWTEGPPQNSSVRAMHLGQDGKPLAGDDWSRPLAIADSACTELHSAVLTTAGDFVIVWEEQTERRTPSRIMAQRIRNDAIPASRRPH